MEAEVEPDDDSHITSSHPQSRPLWRWFVGGFLLVFITPLWLEINTRGFDGYALQVSRQRLWQHDLTGLPRLFPRLPFQRRWSVHSMSITDHQSPAIAAAHYLLALSAGYSAVAIGWFVGKRGKSPNTDNEVIDLG